MKQEKEDQKIQKTAIKKNYKAIKMKNKKLKIKNYN